MKKKSLNAKKNNHNSLIEYLSNKNILKIFNEFKKTLNINEKYAVAISGGPDSIALAYLSKCFSIIHKVKFYYFIVDHRLRNDSSIEAKKVQSILRKFKINCKILIWKGKKPTTSIQSTARKKRYSLLINECNKNKIKNLLIGHHIDDLYENFLLRLLRGSGLKGLTSMDKFSREEKNNIKILRPLINVKKIELQEIAKIVFNFYVEDPSNQNENFKRIRIRKLIKTLQSEGFDEKKLKLTINNLKLTNNAINYYVEDNIKKNTFYKTKKNIFLLKKNFFIQPKEIIFRSLSDVLRKISMRYYSPRGKTITNAISRINSKNFKRTTLGGCLIEKVSESLIISRENLQKKQY